MSIEPAEADTNCFKRTDLEKNNVIKAVINNVVDSDYAQKLKTHEIYVSTIEHLMAALSALGLDNAIIKINTSELPALDGSSMNM